MAHAVRCPELSVFTGSAFQRPSPLPLKGHQGRAGKTLRRYQGKPLRGHSGDTWNDIPTPPTAGICRGAAGSARLTAEYGPQPPHAPRSAPEGPRNRRRYRPVRFIGRTAYRNFRRKPYGRRQNPGTPLPRRRLLGVDLGVGGGLRVYNMIDLRTRYAEAAHQAGENSVCQIPTARPSGSPDPRASRTPPTRHTMGRSPQHGRYMDEGGPGHVRYRRAARTDAGGNGRRRLRPTPLRGRSPARPVQDSRPARRDHPAGRR